MDKEEIKNLFIDLTLWKAGNRRAPHKPLLVLYAISKCYRERIRLLSYNEIEKAVTDLLMAFGPSESKPKPYYPFWRLKNDNIWELINSNKVSVSKSGDPSVSDLRKYNVSGGFTEEIYNLLCDDIKFLSDIVHRLLDDNFPDSIHEDILQAIGLDIETIIKKKRNPEFRERVLRAYEYRCAICGFDVRLGHFPVALEAAHIKWHQAGGPDSEENGLALCALHHKLFDRGAFTISDSLQIQVSERAYGTTGFQEWLMNFHGKYISKPQNPAYSPDNKFISWHVKEVFQGISRYL